MDFNGKVAIITGGAAGIGKAVSKAFLNNGMKILVCDINQAAGKAFVEEIANDLKTKVVFQKCDVSCFDDIKAVFEKAKSAFGRIDIVVNNAGMLSEQNWKRMMEVNFIGVIYGIQLGFEYMGTNKGGSGGFIINTASNAGLGAFELAPVYAGCKHGIVGLTRSYGTQYHFDKTGVTVNAVCPGPTSTNLYEVYEKFTVDEEAAKKLTATLNPISPDEVAKAVLQLLRDGRNGALLKADNDGINYFE